MIDFLTRQPGSLMKWILAPIVLILFLITYGSALAGTDDSSRFDHTISLKAGMIKLRDKNLHPKTHNGFLFDLSYGIERTRSVHQEFHLAMGFGRMKTKLENASESAIFQINTAYSYTFPISGSSRFNLYLGPEISLAYNACFFPNWDDSHLYWADRISAGVRSYFSWQMKKNHELTTRLSVPVISLYNRPDLYRLYKIDEVSIGGILKSLNKSFQPGIWNGIFSLGFETEYRFRIFKAKKGSVLYQFDFLRAKRNDGNPFHQVINQTGFKLYL